MESLALQPSLHVGDSDHDRVDPAVLDPQAKIADAQARLATARLPTARLPTTWLPMARLGTTWPPMARLATLARRIHRIDHLHSRRTPDRRRLLTHGPPHSPGIGPTLFLMARAGIGGWAGRATLGRPGDAFGPADGSTPLGRRDEGRRPGGQDSSQTSSGWIAGPRSWGRVVATMTPCLVASTTACAAPRPPVMSVAIRSISITSSASSGSRQLRR